MIFRKKEEKVKPLRLPTNRKEVFFDLLRSRKMTLFAASSYSFMFFIPLVINCLIFFFYILAAYSFEETTYATIFSLIFYMSLINIPLFMLGFISYGGLFEILKKLVWQEGVVVAHDFFAGFKANFKKSISFAAIETISLFALVTGSTFLYQFFPSIPLPVGVGIGILLLQFIIVNVMSKYYMAQVVIYDNKFRFTLRNSFIFFGANLLKNLAILIPTLGVLAVLLALNFVTQIVGFALFAVFNSLANLLWTLLAQSSFDKYINQENHKSLYRKGLYNNTNQED